MFEVVPQSFDKHVVIPDLHGEFTVAEQIVSQYIDDEAVQFVFLGDVVDRQGVKNDPEQGVYRTLETIRGLGKRAVMTIANHEWTVLAAMYASGGYRSAATDLWLGLQSGRSSYETNTISAYNINERSQQTADLFKQALQDADHLRVLTGVTPYFETEKFIAVHAGIKPQVDWDAQKDYLAQTAHDMSKGVFYDNPEQWFSMPLATDITPIKSTDKVVVSGHAHYLVSTRRQNVHTPASSERSLHGGKRIRLASQLNAPRSDDAFIWQDWDGEIVRIARGLS